MKSGNNESAGDLIATLVRIYMLLIACALFYMLYKCIAPRQRSGDPCRRPEEERIRQGCYPWDDQYSDEENDAEEDKGDSFPGFDHGITDGKDYQEEPGSIEEGQGMDEKVPMLEDRLVTSDYGSGSALTKSPTATR